MGLAVTQPRASNFHKSFGAASPVVDNNSALKMADAVVFMRRTKTKPFAQNEQRALNTGLDPIYLLTTISFKDFSAPNGQFGVTQ